jgi:hypothetical protein
LETSQPVKALVDDLVVSLFIGDGALVSFTHQAERTLGGRRRAVGSGPPPGIPWSARVASATAWSSDKLNESSSPPRACGGNARIGGQGKADIATLEPWPRAWRPAWRRHAAPRACGTAPRPRRRGTETSPPEEMTRPSATYPRHGRRRRRSAAGAEHEEGAWRWGGRRSCGHGGPGIVYLEIVKVINRGFADEPPAMIAASRRARGEAGRAFPWSRTRSAALEQRLQASRSHQDDQTAW